MDIEFLIKERHLQPRLVFRKIMILNFLLADFVPSYPQETEEKLCQTDPIIIMNEIIREATTT